MNNEKHNQKDAPFSQGKETTGRLFRFCEWLVTPSRLIIAWGKDAERIHNLLEQESKP